ncbi:type IV toxin-antitoxin system AbiEi family antitoxin [Amycolatopsis sp. NPDC052450]|uniref:type IV toxin-antitoxin system AbiEi family antitoxin n=1 Tax=Amycolatopsis sp. NPDC052450 TaxID=3363937 RepID=UPI0037CC2FED
MSEVSVTMAAERLGVNTSRVRSLLSSGRLAGRRVGSVWLVDSSDVERRRAATKGVKGRPLSARVTWTSAALFDGLDTDWLSSAERSRLSARWRTNGDAQVCRWWMQSRATVTRYRIAPGDIAELLKFEGVVAGGVSAASNYGTGLGHGAEAEIYASTTTVKRLVDEFFLLADPQGNLTVHEVTADTHWHCRTARVVEGVQVAPRLIVAADLLDSDDTRSRSAGAALLTDVLSSDRERRGQLVAS